MKKRINQGVIITIALLFSIASGCKKESQKNSDTLNKLYDVYKNGDISECTYSGKIVYTAALNVYDAATVVYDLEGKKIGDCNYAWNDVDPICNQLNGCTVVYRCNNHISGEPFVDKYGLSK